jgi:hypothetical protein
MKNGGAWLGFHFAAFALDKSAYPQNWDWYHNQFLEQDNMKETLGDPLRPF